MSKDKTHNMAGEEQGKDRIRATVLKEQDPVTVLQNLPRTVFPVTATVKLHRRQTDDKSHGHFDEPQPVEIREAVQEPYIPETTVYFDNPAERPREGETAWGTRDCVTRLQVIKTHLSENTAVDSNRLSLLGIVLVEIPSRFLTTSNGQPVASPDLYENRGEMTLAYFQKTNSIMAHAIREELGNALPGQSRSPLQLTRMDEVTAKPSRAGHTTTQKASRRRYYTASEAEKHNNLGYTPAVWESQQQDTRTTDARPLETALSNLDRFSPMLSDWDLLAHFTFKGEMETKERFYADELLTR